MYPLILSPDVNPLLIAPLEGHTVFRNNTQCCMKMKGYAALSVILTGLKSFFLCKSTCAVFLIEIN